MSEDRDPYFIAKCVKVLTSLKGPSLDEVVKALKLLQEQLWR